LEFLELESGWAYTWVESPVLESRWADTWAQVCHIITVVSMAVAIMIGIIIIHTTTTITIHIIITHITTTLTIMECMVNLINESKEAGSVDCASLL
jgi:hypothetical protein